MTCRNCLKLQNIIERSMEQTDKVVLQVEGLQKLCSEQQELIKNLLNEQEKNDRDKLYIDWRKKVVE